MVVFFTQNKETTQGLTGEYAAWEFILIGFKNTGLKVKQKRVTTCDCEAMTNLPRGTIILLTSSQQSQQASYTYTVWRTEGARMNWKQHLCVSV